MKIIDLGAQDEDTIRRVALLLMEGFRDTDSPAWLTLEAAVDEVMAKRVSTLRAGP